MCLDTIAILVRIVARRAPWSWLAPKDRRQRASVVCSYQACIRVRSRLREHRNPTLAINVENSATVWSHNNTGLPNAAGLLAVMIHLDLIWRKDVLSAPLVDMSLFALSKRDDTVPDVVVRNLRHIFVHVLPLTELWECRLQLAFLAIALSVQEL